MKTRKKKQLSPSGTAHAAADEPHTSLDVKAPVCATQDKSSLPLGKLGSYSFSNFKRKGAAVAISPTPPKTKRVKAFWQQYLFQHEKERQLGTLHLQSLLEKKKR